MNSFSILLMGGSLGVAVVIVAQTPFCFFVFFFWRGGRGGERLCAFLIICLLWKIFPDWYETKENLYTTPERQIHQLLI